jgi:hypothetical protein
MDKSSLYLEIFGGDGLDEITHQKPVPAVPCLDDPLHDFRKSAGAADATVRQIETDALIDQLAPIPLEVLAERDAERFSPSPVPEPGLDFVKHVLGLGNARLQRKEAIVANDSRRSREISQIVDDWADDYDFASDAMRSALDRIKQGMAQLTNELVLAETL